MSVDLDVADAVVTRATHPAEKRRRKIAMWFVHSSGYFGANTVAWRASNGRLRTKGVFISGTEAAGRTAADFRTLAKGAPTWETVHLSGAAEGECYAHFDTTYLELDGRAFARKLTDLTWVRDEEHGGKRAAKVHALVLPVRRTKGKARRVYVVIVHMPLDNTPERARCWIDCASGLVDLEHDLRAHDPNAEVVIVADFNKNLREPDELHTVRRHLTTPLRMVTSWATGLPAAGGTHGRQVIDFALLVRWFLGACELLADDASSDHRPFRYRLRFWRWQPRPR